MTTHAHLVLVGGGHSHVQVLRRLAMNRRDGKSLHPELAAEHLDVTLVVDDPVAVYSGMVPGYVAGQYQRHELEIDVVPLARMAGVEPILHAASGIDPENKRVLLEGRPPLGYDIVSFDIGSTVAGLELPGVRDYALSSRPISTLVDRVHDAAADCQAAEPRVLVVGAGAGGVELAFTLQTRLRAQGMEPVVTLLHAGDEILPGAARSLVRRARKAASRRNIEILTRRRVQRVLGEEQRAKAVELDDGTEIPADLVVWVTGATAHPSFDPGTLPTDDRGFLSTEPTLQVEGQRDVFAVGDCATIRSTPNPKAGVYAVRQGPVLTDNLGRHLLGRSLKTYRPQSDFLALLNLGDGTAIGSKWATAFEGQWVMRLKDRIDRKFMERFQVLEPASVQLASGFRAMAEAMDAETMQCGGCAAKLEQTALERALSRLQSELPDRRSGQIDGDREIGHDVATASALVGMHQATDVGIWRTPRGDRVVRSVDAFRAFTNDPWLVGGVAALNALSDLWAAGARPAFVLALVGLPMDRPVAHGEETLFQVLAGARQVLDEAGVELLGGHTTLAQELWVGFSVDGLDERSDDQPSPAALEPGDQLVLTKPLGTGVALHAHMLGRLPGPQYASVVEHLRLSNQNASGIAAECGASAVTDVTGFGLLGHLLEMLRPAGTGIRAVLRVDELATVPGALDALEAGIRSTAHPANAQRLSEVEVAPDLDPNRLDLICDPQTSGGLLIGVAEADSGRLLTRLVEAGYEEARIVGEIVAGDDPAASPIRIV